MRITFTPEFLDIAKMALACLAWFAAGFVTGRDWRKK